MNRLDYIVIGLIILMAICGIISQKDYVTGQACGYTGIYAAIKVFMLR